MKFSEFKKNIDEQVKKQQSGGQIQNLQLILDIVKTINHSLILEDVLELVLKNAISLTNSERGFIVLKDVDGELEFKLGLDSKGEKLPASSFNVSKTVVEDVFNTGQSKFLEGAQSDTSADPSKSILRLELETILCSPLITGDKKIGVIYVDSRILKKVKIREITDTFEILAGQAATAIRNAQLYNEQVKAYNALQEANQQLIQSERKALKSSIDSEIGQSLQGFVHLSLLETESLLRSIEKLQKDYSTLLSSSDSITFDRLRLKAKVAIDSIRNIQKFAQALIETSIMNLNKDTGDLNRTIQSVIKYISPMKKFNKITFRTEFNNLPNVTYDSEQLQNLLVNILNNSAEAKIDCTINLRTYSSENNIIIEVEDNGPGIPAGKMKNIFDPPSSQKRGYGLFLCKSIMDRHNGQISINNLKPGIRVKITFPAD